MSRGVYPTCRLLGFYPREPQLRNGRVPFECDYTGCTHDGGACNGGAQCHCSYEFPLKNALGGVEKGNTTKMPCVRGTSEKGPRRPEGGSSGGSTDSFQVVKNTPGPYREIRDLPVNRTKYTRWEAATEAGGDEMAHTNKNISDYIPPAMFNQPELLQRFVQIRSIIFKYKGAHAL